MNPFDPDLTAIGSGYYRVYVNGLEASKHLQEREAVERALELKAASPSASAGLTPFWMGCPIFGLEWR